MTWWRTLRAHVRVELRQLVLNRKRSALVVLLVAIPVAAVVGGATLARITESTPEEQRVQAMGQAVLRVDGIREYDDVESVLERLPPGAETTRLFVGAEDVSVPGRRLTGRLIALQKADLAEGGIAEGMARRVAGEWPENSAEVALSPAILEGLGVGLGGRVTLEFGVERTVSGIVVDSENVEAALVVRVPAASEHRGRTSLLVGRFDGFDEAAVTELATEIETSSEGDLRVRLRSSEGRRSDASLLVFALGCLGFFEAALVIAAAFGIGVRRRQREIGLLGACGATSRGVQLALLLSATVVSALGGLIGCLVGVGGAALAHPFLDGWNQRWNGPFEISPGHLGLGILLGILTALLAAVVPARRASRQPLRVALGAARPPAEDSRRFLRSGLLLVVTGGLLTLLSAREGMVTATLGVIIGPVLGLLGFGLCSRWLLDRLARLAGPLPFAWRLAVRDAGRFRARNGPVVTAILAGMAMSVTVAVLVASLESAIAWIPAPYRSDQVLVEGMEAESVAREVVVEFDGLVAAPLVIAYLKGEPLRAVFHEDPRPVGVGKTVAVGGEELLRVFGAESALEAFREGRIVALQPPDNPGRLIVSSWLGERQIEGLEVFPAAVAERVSEPAFLLNRRVLEQHGLATGPPIRRSLVPWLVRFYQPVDSALLGQLSELAGRRAGTAVDAAMTRAQPPMIFYYMVLGLCGLAGLAIVLVANALSAAESANDERTLLTVGAEPGLVRRHSAARAGYLAFLGCGLAIPGGLLPSRSLFATSNFPIDFVMPWKALALTLIVLPVVAYSAAWLLAAKRPEFRVREVLGCLVLAWLLIPDVVSGQGTMLGSQISGEAGVVWTDHVGEAFDGSPLSGELGRLTVPMKRFGSNGLGSSSLASDQTIEIAFVRYRTTNPNPRPPIFYLAGGPGGSGIEHGGRLATHPQLRLLEHRDVVAVDQRGTGFSRPNLVEREFEVTLDPFEPTSRRSVEAAFTEAAEQALVYWRDQGVDPASWNSRESAADLEAVRQALDLEKILLFGSSYGSHLGFAYLRAFEDHVERALLTKVEGPDHTWKLPSSIHRVLERWERVGSESSTAEGQGSRLQTLLGGLLRTLEAAPPIRTMAPDSSSGEVRLSAFDLRVHIARSLDSTVAMEALPGELEAMAQGNWASLAATSEGNRRVGINAMTLLMDCASGGSPTRRQEIDRERGDADYLLSDSLAAPFFPESCDALGIALSEDFRGPLKVEVPVLFVSGTLDARTPPENVETILPGFSQAAHLVIENAGHEARELMSPEYRAVVQAFLRGEPVVDATLTLPPPRFDLSGIDD